MPRAPIACAIPPLSPTSLTLWSSLLDHAEAFRQLAPWEFISGSSLLGVRDPVSDEIDWCSVMGQNQEVFCARCEMFYAFAYGLPGGIGTLRVMRYPHPLSAALMACRDMRSTSATTMVRRCSPAATVSSSMRIRRSSSTASWNLLAEAPG